MNRPGCTTMARVLVAALPSTVCARAGQSRDDTPTGPRATRPGLLFGPGDVTSLRRKVERGLLAEVFERMKTRASSFLRSPAEPYEPGGGGTAGRILTVHVLEMAMAGHLTGDNRYSRKAADILCASAVQTSVTDYERINSALAAKFADPVGQWAWLRSHSAEYGGADTHGALPALSGVALPYIVLWHDPDLRPVSPAEARWPLSRFFESGQNVARSSWGDAAMVTFKASAVRRLAWNHGGQTTFTLFALGEEIAPDPGAHMIGADLHNTVLVDGKPMTNHGGHHAGLARTLEARDDGGGVHLLGEAGGYYGGVKAGRLRRRLYFARSPHPYLLVLDDIELDGKGHEYLFQMFTAVGNRFEIQAEAAKATLTGARLGSRCDVHLLWPPRAAMAERQHRGKRRNPLLGIGARAVNPRFAVLMCPYEAEAGPPRVSAQGDPSDMRVRIDFADGTGDRLRVTPEGVRETRNGE